MAERYDPHMIEARWRTHWQAAELYRTDLDASQQPFYNLVEFPYPSGEGLHVGHVYTYAGADTLGRLRRMQGYNVFQPMGFDAFGIHSENYALKVGAHPAELIPTNIRRFRDEQLSQLGMAFDWSRQIDTTDPTYYRWTQWLFVQLFKAGLAYQAEAPVNWCPRDQTVLDNEQVVGGRCERCDTLIERRVMKQWFLRITAYAERLLDFSGGDFPEEWKARQRAWIGRSAGVTITFPISGRPGSDALSVFTTRPDTLFGAAFVALAPEHPLAAAVATAGRREAVEVYIAAARNRPERERTIAAAKTGVFTGAFAVSPATGAEVPIWVADYVLPHGGGAVMGVPAHDERDHAFAVRHGLPVSVVIEPPAGTTLPFTAEGPLVDSGLFSGTPSQEAREAIAIWLEQQSLGRPEVRYRLHDWLISRQRYWGPPTPIIHCERCGAQPVPKEQLPVLLPRLEEFRSTGVAPLAASPEFVSAPCPRCGGPGRRETDVSDNFLDSAWYFLRYPSTDVVDRPWDPGRTARWLPVDQYAGGPEHTTMHHLYARFVTMALHDLGHLPVAEPFRHLRLHGTITRDGAKMSKSRGNVVSPDAYLARYGADITRMYMLFLGPWEEGGDFSDSGIGGVARFTGRVWATLTGEASAGPPDPSRVAEAEQLRRRLVARVTAGIEEAHFHVAIAALMEGLSWLRANGDALDAESWRRFIHTYTLLLAPLAPHLAEELWAHLGGSFSVHMQPWPAAAQVEEPAAELLVQVGGKVRDRIVVPVGADEEAIRQAALASPRVQAALAGRSPKRIIIVPGRVVNIVP